MAVWPPCEACISAVEPLFSSTSEKNNNKDKHRLEDVKKN
jgi:hypothetical protein